MAKEKAAKKAPKKARALNKPAKLAEKVASNAKQPAKNLGAVPRWDLTNVYPSLDSDQFEAAVQDLGMQLDEIDAFQQKHKVEKNEGGPVQSSTDELANVLSELLDKMNRVRRLYGTLGAYVASFTTTDSFNQAARKIESELELYGVRLRKQETSFRAWVGGMGNQLPQLVGRPGNLADHAFYLQETHIQSQFLMSPAEESLAAELTLSGANAWTKLHNTTTSQLSVDFKLDGKVQKMPMPALINLRTHPDGEVRRRGYEAEMETWEKAKETYAAALNGVKGEVNTVDKRRARTDALHASIDTALIDRQP